MNKNRLLPSLRSLILPLSLAATPLTALAWPTLTIPTNALQADAVQAFSEESLGAFELAEIKVKPAGQSSAVPGLVGAFALPVTSITIDGLKVVGGKSNGAALRFERYDWETGATEIATLGNFRIDFKSHVIHADVFLQSGERRADLPVFNFKEQTALAIRYKFPLSITAHQVLDQLFLTLPAQQAFIEGLKLNEVLAATLEAINFGEIRINVGVKLRTQAISTKPYRP